MRVDGPSANISLTDVEFQLTADVCPHAFGKQHRWGMEGDWLVPDETESSSVEILRMKPQDFSTVIHTNVVLDMCSIVSAAQTSLQHVHVGAKLTVINSVMFTDCAEGGCIAVTATGAALHDITLVDIASNTPLLDADEADKQGKAADGADTPAVLMPDLRTAVRITTEAMPWRLPTAGEESEEGESVDYAVETATELSHCMVVGYDVGFRLFSPLDSSLEYEPPSDSLAREQEQSVQDNGEESCLLSTSSLTSLLFNHNSVLAARHFGLVVRDAVDSAQPTSITTLARYTSINTATGAYLSGLNLHLSNAVIVNAYIGVVAASPASLTKSRRPAFDLPGSSLHACTIVNTMSNVQENTLYLSPLVRDADTAQEDAEDVDADTGSEEQGAEQQGSVGASLAAMSGTMLAVGVHSSHAIKIDGLHVQGVSRSFNSNTNTNSSSNSAYCDDPTSECGESESEFSIIGPIQSMPYVENAGKAASTVLVAPPEVLICGLSTSLVTSFAQEPSLVAVSASLETEFGFMLQNRSISTANITRAINGSSLQSPLSRTDTSLLLSLTKPIFHADAVPVSQAGRDGNLAEIVHFVPDPAVSINADFRVTFLPGGSADSGLNTTSNTTQGEKGEGGGDELLPGTVLLQDDLFSLPIGYATHCRQPPAHVTARSAWLCPEHMVQVLRVCIVDQAGQDIGIDDAPEDEDFGDISSIVSLRWVSANNTDSKSSASQGSDPDSSTGHLSVATRTLRIPDACVHLFRAGTYDLEVLDSTGAEQQGAGALGQSFRFAPFRGLPRTGCPFETDPSRLLGLRRRRRASDPTSTTTTSTSTSSSTMAPIKPVAPSTSAATKPAETTTITTTTTTTTTTLDNGRFSTTEPSGLTPPSFIMDDSSLEVLPLVSLRLPLAAVGSAMRFSTERGVEMPTRYGLRLVGSELEPEAVYGGSSEEDDGITEPRLSMSDLLVTVPFYGTDRWTTATGLH